MKNILKIAAAGAILASTGGTAWASDTAQGSVTTNATVPATCYIRGITAASGLGTLTPAGAGTTTGATLDYSTGLVDTVTALSSAQTSVLTVDAYCNYASAPVKLSSDNGGLTNTAATTAVGTFNRRINYTATFSGWGSAPNATVTTAGTATTSAATPITGAAVSSTGAVNTTSAVLTINTVGSGTTPMLAGSYSDVLRVTFGPAS